MTDPVSAPVDAGPAAIPVDPAPKPGPFAAPSSVSKADVAVEPDYFPVVPVASANADPTEDQKAAAEQRAEDTKARLENPNAPVIRAANPDVGGESF